MVNTIWKWCLTITFVLLASTATAELETAYQELHELWESESYQELLYRSRYYDRAFPDNFEILNYMALARYGLKQYHEGINAAERALKLAPESPVIRGNIIHGYLYLYKMEKAVALYREALRLHSNEDYLMSQIEDIFVSNLLTLYINNRFNEMYPAVETLASLRSESSSVLNVYGLWLWHLGQIDASADTFKKCTRIDPGFAACRFHLGLLFTEQGQLHLGLQMLKDALSLHPSESRIVEAIDEVDAAIKRESARERAARIIKNEPQRKCEYKPVMTNEDYATCGLSPPTAR